MSIKCSLQFTLSVSHTNHFLHITLSRITNRNVLKYIESFYTCFFNDLSMIRFFEYIYQYEISRNIVHQNVMDPNEFFSMEREFIKTKHRIGT